MRNHVIFLLFFLFPTIHFLQAFRSPSSLNAYRIMNRRKPSFMGLRIRGDNAEESEQSPNVAPPQTEQPIKTPIDVILNEAELEETFAKGSGKGGQKINKTMNRVVLVHKPTGLRVSCQEVRDLDTNRKLARRMLVEKLDVYYNQELSKLRIEQQKVRKRKSDAKRKSKKKYAKLSERRKTEDSSSNSNSDTDDEDEEEDNINEIDIK